MILSVTDLSPHSGKDILLRGIIGDGSLRLAFWKRRATQVRVAGIARLWKGGELTRVESGIGPDRLLLEKSSWFKMNHRVGTGEEV